MNPVRASFLAVLVLAAMHPGWSATVPQPGRADARVRTVAYNGDDVVQLQGVVGYQIHIEWAPGEEFVNLGAGDAGGFDIGVERNHFFIKPRQQPVRTNFTVLTNRRAYHFEYRVGPRAGISASAPIFSIRFTYPEDEARWRAAEADRERAELAAAQRAAARPRNTDYWFCGSTTIKPSAAVDDGLHTRLRFEGQREIPAVFVLHDDNTESLVNSHVERDEVVLHRVARRWVLRRGDLVGCVVNKAVPNPAPQFTTVRPQGAQIYLPGTQP